MPASPIRKLVPFADAAKERGVHIHHLNIGQPDIFTPQVMLDAIKNISFKVLEYSHSAGNASYRKGLVQYYASKNVALTTNDILVTTGGSEAILFAMMCCCDPGDEIIVPEPFYANYNGFAITAGVVLVPVNASIHNGFALPPITNFEALVTPKTKAILICNPGNPTGYLYTDSELLALRDLVLKHDLYLFADEVYREFVYDGETHTSILTLSGLEANAIVVDSISKRYSACGARIGMLVSRNASFMQTALKFAQARLSPPSFGQIAAEAALALPANYFDEVLTEYTDRRNILVDGLNKIPGVFCPKPKGAFYCIASLPIADANHFCQWMLEHFNYNNETVMMAPANGFYSKPNLGRNEVRLAYVLNGNALKRALTCLEKGLAAYQIQFAENQKAAT